MIEQSVNSIINHLNLLDNDKKIEELNKIKKMLHEISPFKDEPVDCVVWVKNSEVKANNYNPNSVAPPEMKLLYQSIKQDGYTQPLVSWERENDFEVVDGFHRHRVGKEYKDIEERVHGYLPLAVINGNREELGDRMVSTIRHNRARGKHNVDSMSDIVVELKNRNWTDAKIQKNLGMDQDEVLRLCQISGLTEMFSDCDFTHAWDIGIFDEEEIQDFFEEQEEDDLFNDLLDSGELDE